MANTISGSGSFSGLGNLMGEAVGGGGMTYSVGDTGPGGGKIYYDAGSVQAWGRYLEVAPSDWDGGAAGDNSYVMRSDGTDNGPFGYSYTSIANSGTAIGTGLSNTTALITVSSPAALAVDSYSGGSVTDWFIPSKDELSTLYTWRTNNSISGFVNAQYTAYWSSSLQSDDEFGENNWYVSFYNGNVGNNGVSESARIRPIRYV